MLQYFSTKIDVIIGLLRKLINKSFSENGFTVIADAETSPEGLEYSSIQILSDTTVTADVIGSKKGDQSINLALTAPTIIYGRFTNITSTGGTLIASIG